MSAASAPSPNPSHGGRGTASRPDPEKVAAQFNEAYPLGTEVVYKQLQDDVSGLKTRTRSEATVIGNQPVVWVEGKPGCVSLYHITIVGEDV